MANNFNQNRMNSIGAYLKECFGEKVIKLSLEGGFTCPNRDGSKGTGGCTFCASDGTGHFAEPYKYLCSCIGSQRKIL